MSPINDIEKTANPIRVLIVDDSPSAAQYLFYLLSSDPSIQVIGTAYSGEEAILSATRLKPNLITMDINMPGIDGFEATRRIMETIPVPIVIVSSHYSPKDSSRAFDAISAGALAILPKPVGLQHPSYRQNADELITTVKLMAEVRVVTHKKGFKTEIKPVSALTTTLLSEIKMIAMGASTGGPPIIQMILSGLIKPFPVPILITQHITKGFTQNFANWLSESTGFCVDLPFNGQIANPGTVYLAPDDTHMGVNKQGQIVLSKDPPENNLRPAVSYLFRSVAEAFPKKTIGILLTGMGKDGAQELKLMKERGAITIAQDKETSIVHGMPGEAIRLKGVTYILPDFRIAEALESILGKQKMERMNRHE